MVRRRLLWVVTLPVALLGPPALVTACSTSVGVGSPSGEGGGGGSPSSSSSSSSSTLSGPFPDSGHHDAFDEFVDPGCPDAAPPKEDFDCNPYKQDNGDCGPNEGCYIDVVYPTQPCGQEIYGAHCQPTGPGQQGDPCESAGGCDGGFVCVVSGSGNQCVELCNLTGNDGCPSGLVCEPIDVQGFGGCL